MGPSQSCRWRTRKQEAEELRTNTLPLRSHMAKGLGLPHREPVSRTGNRVPEAAWLGVGGQAQSLSLEHCSIAQPAWLLGAGMDLPGDPSLLSCGKAPSSQWKGFRVASAGGLKFSKTVRIVLFPSLS